MGKYKYIILTLLMFIVCPKVDAALCSDNVKVNYQSLAKNISSTYEYVEANNTFNIIFTNVSSNLYIKDIDTEIIYGYTGSEMVLSNFIPGKSYKFGIYTSDFDCRNDNMYTVYVTLPYYNPYHKDNLCTGIENYKYCKKFINKSVTYEEFINNTEKYRKKLEQEKQSDVVDNNKSIMDYVIDFYINYYYVILPIIIVLCLVYRWKYNKEQDLF